MIDHLKEARDALRAHIERHGGEISHGTLRGEDLGPTFLSFLQVHGECLMAEAFVEPDDWDSEDGTEAIVELETLLCNLAPDGYHFGSHEGDGACFGFWLNEEDE